MAVRPPEIDEVTLLSDHRDNPRFEGFALVEGSWPNYDCAFVAKRAEDPESCAFPTFELPGVEGRWLKAGPDLKADGEHPFNKLMDRTPDDGDDELVNRALVLAGMWTAPDQFEDVWFGEEG